MRKFLVNLVWNMELISTHNLHHTDMNVYLYPSFFWWSIWPPGQWMAWLLTRLCLKWRLTSKRLTNTWGHLLPDSLWQGLKKDQSTSILTSHVEKVGQRVQNYYNSHVKYSWNRYVRELHISVLENGNKQKKSCELFSFEKFQGDKVFNLICMSWKIPNDYR